MGVALRDAGAIRRYGFINLVPFIEKVAQEDGRAVHVLCGRLFEKGPRLFALTRRQSELGERETELRVGLAGRSQQWPRLIDLTYEEESLTEETLNPGDRVVE